MNASDLPETEAIKQLEARYSRLLDTKQWEAWRELFTEDFQAEIHGPHPVIHFEKRDEMVESKRKILAEAPSVPVSRSKGRGRSTTDHRLWLGC